ncbi:MAG: hypothetical protein R2682_14410 [Pyrinomonadaceae bacterium]
MWLSKYGDARAVDAYNEFIAGVDVIVIGRAHGGVGVSRMAV